MKWPGKTDTRWVGEVGMPTDEEVAQVAGYDKLLLLKAIDSEFLRGERITDVVTWHDESCASVLHDGICNCSPEATLTGRMGRYFVRKDGTVEPLDPN